MKILVAGGLGFIGSVTTVSLIQNGDEVVVCDNLYNSKIETLERIKSITGIKPKFYKLDVCDENKLDKVFKKEKFDAVIHFAGFKAVGESCEKPLEYYENNISTTFKILRCMRKYGVKNLVFSSSATVYGVPKKVPLVETDPTSDATNPYGESKLMIERILTDVSKADPSLNIALLRYFNPIGAHPSGLLGEDPNGIPNNLFPILLQVAFKEREKLSVYGNDYDTKDGTGVRDYIHVADLAEGHVLALKKLYTNPGLVIYNLGTGKGTSVLELIKCFEDVTKVKINKEFGPRRDGDVASNFADCKKAEKELGFKCKYTIKDACKHGYEFKKRERGE